MKKTICVVGSGAGAGPVIYEMAKAGHKVIVLEKGAWLKTEDYSKDEISMTRRDVVTPLLEDEPYVIEYQKPNGEWYGRSNADGGQNFWNGSMVGGSSNFMSGYFHRMKPVDFKLKSTYGDIKGANVVDWPISYEDMEPYYEKVERVIGVSGKVVKHKFLEPRSTSDFPYKPLAENYVSSLLDKAANDVGIEMIPNPRAILSSKKGDRNTCYLSNFCGSYACSSDAKGSSRAALINEALETGNVQIIPKAKVFHLQTNGLGKIIKAHYHSDDGDKYIEADVFVVAAQAIETSRLLLLSENMDFPNGLANNNEQVGKNLVFSAGGVGGGIIDFDDYTQEEAQKLNMPGNFVNRTIHHFYELEKDGKKAKGGVVDFLFEHANPIGKAIRNKWNDDGTLLYGEAFQQKLKNYFTKQRKIKFEVFIDWQPNDNCFVTLDDEQIDKWGDKVAKLRLQHNEHDVAVGEIMTQECEKVLGAMGCKDIYSSIGTLPPPNLQAGGCRFGTDPRNSVLDANCKAHEVANLYITDGSSFPTGGSVTYTWTIYANAFRVADAILKELASIK
ncbi:MAG: oxidoreductase [Bacteroidetes bacterium 4572_112]|nr:MAG: oxidoreductase [Bacteroidetes bacterium 4572_112]